ncbi:MAG: magnesium transporter [Bacteroidota bacterium]
MKNSILEFEITTSVIKIRVGTNVVESLNFIQANKFEFSDYVFVVDDENKLIGFASLFTLMKNQGIEDISSLIIKCETVNQNKSLEFAANFAIKNYLNFVPVVNQLNEFIGVFDTKSLIKTLRKEHIEDLHKIAGIRKEISISNKAISESPLRSVSHRLPWLLVGLLGSFVATFVMSSFKESLESNVTLAFFIPGIVYLADAVGTQTETIVIRGLSLSWTSLKKIFLRELISGLMIGIILGGISFFVCIIAGFQIEISFIVFMSVIFAGTIATSIGLFLPSIFSKLNMDPAFGSGPLATVIQDVLSILIYLVISNLFFH